MSGYNDDLSNNSFDLNSCILTKFIRKLEKQRVHNFFLSSFKKIKFNLYIYIDIFLANKLLSLVI